MTDSPPVGTEPRREPAPVPWRAREAVLIYLGAQIVLFPIVAVMPRRPGSNLPTDLTLLVSYVVAQTMLGIGVLVYVHLRYERGAYDLGFHGFTRENITAGLGTGVLGLGAGYAVVIAAVWVLGQVTGTEIAQPKQIELEAADPALWMFAVLGVVLVVITPIAEEAFFRGFLYPAFRRWTRRLPANLLSSAIFAIAHFQPLVMLATFVLGIMLAQLVDRRGSIVPAVVAHMLFNAVGFALFVSQS